VRGSTEKKKQEARVMEKKNMKKNEAVSQLYGKVWKVMETEGTRVRKGQEVMVIEAMKLEIPVTAPKDGVLVKILAKPGDDIAAGQPLAIIA